MQQKKNQQDANQKVNSSTMPVKEPSEQKQNHESGDHASEMERPEKEPCLSTHDVSESPEEGKTLCSKNEKDSDTLLMQKPSLNPIVPGQESNPPLVANLTSAKRKIISDVLLPVQSTRGTPSSQSDELKPNNSNISEKTVDKLQPRRNPDNTGGYSSQSDKVTTPSSASEKLSTTPKEEPQPSNLQPTQCIDAGNHELVSKDEICNSTPKESVSANLVQMSSSSVEVSVPESHKKSFSYSAKLEKLQPRRNPEPVAQGSQSDVESTPSKVSDKGSDDGYNWRKYGQKFVKGNEFIRSYYKCTYLNCLAKKQVERSLDGCNTEVNYLGNHQHPKPQPGPQVTSAFQVRIPETAIVPAPKNAEPITDNGSANQLIAPKEFKSQSTVARTADGVIVAVSSSNNDNNDKDDYADYKRQKREITSAEDNLVNKPNNDFRHVVQMRSEVDIVNDGYRWRKYGQKLVKGNPNPRSYYRCSNAGCPVKKHVERASHDSTVVITTYEGQHDHDMPLSRTVNQSIAADDTNTLTTTADSKSKPGEMTTNGESRSKSEENNPVGLEMVVHVSAI